MAVKSVGPQLRARRDRGVRGCVVGFVGVCLLPRAWGPMGVLGATVASVGLLLMLLVIAVCRAQLEDRPLDIIGAAVMSVPSHGRARREEEEEEELEYE